MLRLYNEEPKKLRVMSQLLGPSFIYSLYSQHVNTVIVSSSLEEISIYC